MRKGAPVGVEASLVAVAPAASALNEPIDSNAGSARHAPRAAQKMTTSELARNVQRQDFDCFAWEFISLSTTCSDG